MPSRAATPGAITADHNRIARAQADRTNAQNLAGALAVLDARRRDKLLRSGSDRCQGTAALVRPGGLAAESHRSCSHRRPASTAAIFSWSTRQAAAGDILQHSVWSAPGIATPPEFQNAQEPVSNVGMKSWIAKLERGETIVGHVRDFDLEKRAFFELGGVKSVLVAPVFADDRWSGLIGFDDCHMRARLDGGGDRRDQYGGRTGWRRGRRARRNSKTLADANRIIENSPTILYRAAPQFPFPLTYMSREHQAVRLPGRRIARRPLDAGRNWSKARIGRRCSAKFNRSARAKRIPLISRIPLEAARRIRCRWVGRPRHRAARRRRQSGRHRRHSDRHHRPQERRNDELSFSKLLLTTAIENSPDAIIIVDASDRIIMFNQRFVELWDVPPELVRAGVDQPVLKTRGGADEERKRIPGARPLPLRPSGSAKPRGARDRGRAHRRASLRCACTTRKRNYLGRVWFFRDITETKRAAEKMIAEMNGKIAPIGNVVDEQTRERIMIGEELRHAITHRELELFYQPQVEIKTGRIVGLEGLLRWNHPSPRSDVAVDFHSHRGNERDASCRSENG